MSLTRFEDNHEPDDRTPLLPNQEREGLRGFNPTPLPISQICALFTVWLAESTISHSMSPYLNQLVRELPEVGGDARKVGYYTGIIVSLHYAAEAATSFLWNRLSDHVGRKRVLLLCLPGATLSILLFGLSHSFWALALSRCLHGMMKGHVGVVKSMVAELTDETNIARGFSMLPVAWSLGYAIGPSIGGFFCRPQGRWPHIFSHPFWANYPYFLPCLVVAVIASLSFIFIALYLEETLKARSSRKLQLGRVNPDMSQDEAGDSPDLDMSPNESDKPPPLRSILTKPVVVTVVNFGMFALLSMVAVTLIPLVWSTPVEFGGLNLSPASIGLWLSLYGATNGFFQFIFFPLLVGRFGLRPVFISSIVACGVIYAIFPYENLGLRTAAGGGPNLVVWLLVILQLSSLCISELGYATVYLYVSSAAPNKQSFGAVNGLSQMVVAIQSTIGPASADALYAFSLTHNVLGGKFAYVVFLGVVCVGLGASTQLPLHTWVHRKE